MSEVNSITFPPASQPQSYDYDWTPTVSQGVQMVVNLAAINVDEAFQLRASTNPAIVTQYAQIMNDNDPDGWQAFPLIKILKVTDEGLNYKLYVVGGFHRLAAMQQNGYEQIRAIVISGRYLDGFTLAGQENNDRSQPLTNADKRKKCETVLMHPELAQWNMEQLSRWFGVDRKTLETHRLRMLSDAKFASDMPQPDMLKYIDKHGNVSLRKRRTERATADLPALRKQLQRIVEDGDINDIDFKQLGKMFHVDPEVVREELRGIRYARATGKPAEDIVDPEEIERQDLLIEIADTQRLIDQIHTMGDVLDKNAQRNQLKLDYAAYAKIDIKEDLPVEGLRHLLTVMKEIYQDGRQERTNLASDVYHVVDAIDNGFMELCGDWKTVRDARAELAKDFPLLAEYRNRFNLPIPQVKAMLVEVKAAAKAVKKEGYDSYMPLGWAATEMDEAEADAPPPGQLVKQTKDAKKAADNAFKEITDGSWRVNNEFYKEFVKSMKTHHDGPAPTVKQIRYSDYNYKDRTVAELNAMIAGFNEIAHCLKADPRPQWILDFIDEVAFQKSRLEIDVYDYNRNQLLDFKFVPRTVLSTAEKKTILKAVKKAIGEAHAVIMNQHGYKKGGPS